MAARSNDLRVLPIIIPQYSFNFKVAQLVTFLQQPTSPIQLTPQTQAPVTTSQAPQPYEPRTTPTNLTTFQANVPLATFQASDKSSISPASSSLGYAKDSPLSSSLGQNSSSGVYNNEKLSPNGSERIGQTTPLVYVGSQKRGPKSSNPHFQELAITAFNHNYNVGNIPLPLETTNNRGELHDETSDGLDHDLNPQWEFQSTVEAANYTILSDWSPARDYLIDDFTILGLRPQDEITTEL